MDKQGCCWTVIFEPVENIDENLSEFLEEYFDVVVCDYTDEGLEQYVGYKGLSFDEQDFKKSAQKFGTPLLPYEIKFLEEKNWLKETVIEFPPIEVEDFLIYGIHEKNPVTTNKIAIKIYAATAFGSNHQTTTGCLKAISELNKINAKHNKILDIGTGSGILSLAAAKLWSTTQITAVDIDEEAVLVTRQNAESNDIKNIIAEVSNGYASELIHKNSPFDIILANILARPLIEMAQDLYNNLRKDGYCVLSGFNLEQKDWVVSTHEALGLELINTYEQDGWLAVLMRKKS